MRIDLSEKIGLCCPVCSLKDWNPAPLTLEVESEHDGDVISGHLRCAACPRRYPILEGVAVLDPEPLRITYDRPDFLQAYLWTHFADLAADPPDPYGPPRGDYFDALAAQEVSGVALDLGCNVGRGTLDLAARTDFTLGIERSFEAVKRAREIVRTGRVAFHLIDEGDRGRYVDLDAGDLVRPNLEFVCGDAAALPVPPESVDAIVAANLLDRLRDPELFLRRSDRVLRSGGTLVLTAPFTWREEITPRDRWLGDATKSSEQVLLSWLEGQDYEIEEVRELSLVIRNHSRFFELIRPVLFRARRQDG